jgi:hypothetical protein
VASGVVTCKFWLQISKAEQLRRFQGREKTGFKRYKITDEDYAWFVDHVLGRPRPSRSTGDAPAVWVRTAHGRAAPR